MKKSLLGIQVGGLQGLVKSYNDAEEINIKQEFLLTILNYCHHSKHRLPDTVIGDLIEELEILFSGHSSELFCSLDVRPGRQNMHPDLCRHVSRAVCYVNKCKEGFFTRRNHIKFIQDCYKVDRSTVHSWLNDCRYNSNMIQNLHILTADHTETGNDDKNAEWFLKTISGNLYQKHRASHSNHAHIIRAQ